MSQPPSSSPDQSDTTVVVPDPAIVPDPDEAPVGQGDEPEDAGDGGDDA